MKTQKKNLLLIEDEKIDQMAFKRYANSKEFSYDFDIADSIEEALVLLKSNKYDLIVSDYFLGDGTAFDILENVKDIPIVITTGAGDEEIAVKAMKLGAYDYLIKDIEGYYLKMLPVTVENAISRFKVEIELKEYHENLEKLIDERTLELKLEIKERKQAEESLLKLSTAVTQSPSVIVVTDLNGNIEYVNPKFTEITGYSTKEFIGKNSRILNSGEQTGEIYKELWKTISSGKEWRGEFRNKKKNGELFWEAASISPIFDKQGKIINYVKVAEDITERKKAEDNLKKALEKATESDRLKSAFLATMSHELRTPLNAIIGFSGIIDNDLPIEEIVGFAKTIKSSGEHLLTIVEDLFDITLIESGMSIIQKNEINLHDILKEVLEVIKIEQYEMNKSNLNLNHSIPIDAEHFMIVTDGTKLRQILINLLKNALKFTHEGYIKYGYSIETDKDKPMLKFYIEDTGIGISEDKQKLIFDIFRQGDDSHTRIYGGTGIGLSISKKLTGLLGGEIWIESEVGAGSTFYFTIPYEGISQADEEDKAKTIAKLNKNIKERKVLIVEDDEASYEFLKILLEKNSYNTLWAKDGKESIKVCKESPDIDLVLMDINMMVMNGYTATKEIKKFRPDLPIIAQTAYAISGDREKAIDAGCNDYISKPIDKDKLMEMVGKWFQV